MSNAASGNSKHSLQSAKERAQRSPGNLSPGFGKIAIPALTAVLAIHSGLPRQATAKSPAKR